jgi:Tfp pilus assembly protein PilF
MKIPAAILFALALACVGCGSLRHHAAPVAADAQPRRTAEAVVHHQKALEDLKAGRLEEAQQELKAALDDDLFYGPAHNNLGIVYYQQKKYYEAAWEFQAAAKLMPRKAEPLNNLGLVFEAAGKLQEASDWYEKALSAEPDTAETVGNLARVRTRANRQDERTRQLLDDVARNDPRPEWVAWARERLMSMHDTEPAPATPAGREPDAR